MKVALVSLGCAKNLVDSEIMLALLKKEGYILTNDPCEAGVIVINTCGFIETAKKESINKILEMASLKEKTCRVLLAAGCLAQRYKEELLSEIPELDGIFGINDVCAVTEAIRRGLEGEKVVFTGGEYRTPDDAPRLLSTPAHTAYLKIAEGCDNRCTYCAIPDIRGPYESRDYRSILSEAERLVAGGVRELNLIAQDITLYGVDRSGERELPFLLRDLSQLQDLSWIRLLYAYPERVDKRLISVLARAEKVCKYLDLPLQHAADTVLCRMGRNITGKEALQLITTLRCHIPGIILRSSFIIGFPGESEEEFQKLLEFMSEARIDRVGFFTYSREEGTPAARFRKQVPWEIKKERLERAIAVQSKIIQEKNQNLVGTVLPVMLDGRSAQNPSVTLARTAGHAPEVDGYVRLYGLYQPYGRIVRAKITGFEGNDLLGEVCDEFVC